MSEWVVVLGCSEGLNNRDILILLHGGVFEGTAMSDVDESGVAEA